MPSIFIGIDQEKIAAVEESVRKQLAEEIYYTEQVIIEGVKANDGMEAEVEEHGEESYPPVAMAMREMSKASLEKDIKWLAHCREVQTKYFPEDVDPDPKVEVFTLNHTEED